MKRFKLVPILIMFTLAGCAGMQSSKLCSGVPFGEYSVICEISDKANTTPEAVGTMVKVADLLLLNETHTARQAWDFFTELENKSKEVQSLDGATYNQLLAYAASKYLKLPAKVQAAIELIRIFYDIDLPDVKLKLLSKYDWYLVDTLLADQKAVIKPFM